MSSDFDSHRLADTKCTKSHADVVDQMRSPGCREQRQRCSWGATRLAWASLKKLHRTHSTCWLEVSPHQEVCQYAHSDLSFWHHSVSQVSHSQDVSPYAADEVGPYCRTFLVGSFCRTHKNKETDFRELTSGTVHSAVWTMCTGVHLTSSSCIRDDIYYLCAYTLIYLCIYVKNLLSTQEQYP